jgi:hypothetical protein
LDTGRGGNTSRKKPVDSQIKLKISKFPLSSVGFSSEFNFFRSFADKSENVYLAFSILPYHSIVRRWERKLIIKMGDTSSKTTTTKTNETAMRRLAPQTRRAKNRWLGDGALSQWHGGEKSHVLVNNSK